MHPRHYDVLILGQGLAGSALAWFLTAMDRRVCVIDDGHRSASSRVAAGLINPLAGMRFNRRPELGDWLTAADAWYMQLADRFGEVFYHATPMLRLLRSEEQRRFHTRRREDPLTRSLLEGTFDAGHCPEPVIAPHGGFLQHHTAYVDMPLLLDHLRAWLRARDALHESAVDHGRIALSDNGVQVDGLSARHLVFCEGAAMRFNPWFKQLPLAPDKGEILDLRFEHWRPGHIINGAHWLVPLQDGRVRLGSTHEHHELDSSTTAVAREALLTGLHALIGDRFNAKVEGQQAGIRPATNDRYPLLGRHPEHPVLSLCNGFGARGALSIPWYARRMAAHLVSDEPLPAEADIRRCT